MGQTTMSRTEAVFGPFRFDRSSGVLLDGENRIQLGLRARALLGALVDKPGELVSKLELYEHAWPGLRVDERNLRVQMSGLRKALGDHGALIRTEASLGYRFTGRLSPEATPDKMVVIPPRCPSSLAEAPIGREEVIGSIIEVLGESRLVTLLGSGGIGKTTVALAVARRMEYQHRDGVHVVDLSRATDEQQVLAAVIGALGLTGDAAGTIERVLLALQGKRVLLVLDCCEHVAEHAAAHAERILKETDRAVVLATSRETLRVAGEIVWRLGPPDVPGERSSSNAKDASAYRSVQLFLKIARQHVPTFRLDDRNASAVVAICRRLDGIPLAIELAASMVGVVSLEEVLHGLDERLSLLTMGNGLVISRHRSMFASLEWSFGLLSVAERNVLSRLATFRGSFTLDAALAVASNEDMRPEQVRTVIIALANKSLLNVSQAVCPIQYVLLETTRAYVLQRHEDAQAPDFARAEDAETSVPGLAQVEWETLGSAGRPIQLQECFDREAGVLSGIAIEATDRRDHG